MPYRYAHQLLLFVLMPIVLVAFWPHYFGDLRGASFAFHMHGVTATLWILLVAAQSWTIQTRRFPLHRLAGRLTFVIAPLFAVGAALAMQGMALKYVTKSDPFYAALGPLLGLDDLISATALLLLVRAVMVNRRRPHLHGGYLLTTVMLVVPPIVSRHDLPVPPQWHAGELIAAAPAVLLAAAAPCHAKPFLILLGILSVIIVATTIAGFSPTWVAVFIALPGINPWLLAIPPSIIAFAILWSGWRPAWWLRPPPTQQRRFSPKIPPSAA